MCFQWKAKVWPRLSNVYPFLDFNVKLLICRSMVGITEHARSVFPVKKVLKEHTLTFPHLSVFPIFSQLVLLGQASLLQHDSLHSAGMSSFRCDEHLVSQRLPLLSQPSAAVTRPTLPELPSVAWLWAAEAAVQTSAHSTVCQRRWDYHVCMQYDYTALYVNICVSIKCDLQKGDKRLMEVQESIHPSRTGQFFCKKKQPEVVSSTKDQWLNEELESFKSPLRIKKMADSSHHTGLELKWVIKKMWKKKEATAGDWWSNHEK